MRSVLLGALALIPLRAVRAQEAAVVYGSVRDSSGQPLRATVRVVNRGGASVADAQGRYQLRVPAGLVILRVGFLGFQPLDDTLTLAVGIRSSATTGSILPSWRCNPSSSPPPSARSS